MSSNYYPFFLKTVFCYRLFLPEKQWKSGTAAIFMTLAVLGVISLPPLTNATMLAQTPLLQSQCTDVEINKYIEQLNKGEIADFNALVACNSKAVPVLIKALGNQNEEFRIPTIAVLGEIGSKAASAVPFLNASLKDENRDVRIIAVQALRKIGQDPVPPLIQALKSKDWTIRYRAAKALRQFGIEARDAVPALHTALKDTNITVRFAADNALGEINSDFYSDIWGCGSCSNTVSVSQTIKKHISTNSPVMCRIPIIRAVLRWKCP